MLNKYNLKNYIWKQLAQKIELILHTNRDMGGNTQITYQTCFHKNALRVWKKSIYREPFSGNINNKSCSLKKLTTKKICCIVVYLLKCVMMSCAWLYLQYKLLITLWMNECKELSMTHPPTSLVSAKTTSLLANIKPVLYYRPLWFQSSWAFVHGRNWRAKSFEHLAVYNSI